MIKVKYRHIFVAPGSVLSTHLIYREIARSARFASGMLLDLGCGAKPYRPLFKVNRYIGLDLDKRDGKFGSLDVFGNALMLPFADSTFDTVLATELLEHVPDPNLLLREVVRVLKPSGAFIFSAPFFHPLHEQPRDYYRYTIYGLIQLAEIHNLHVVFARQRGGRFIVLIDMCLRIISTIIKTIALKTKMPKVFINIMMQFIVIFPQRFLIVLMSLWPNESSNDDMKVFLSHSAYTLGHVVVARKL